MEAGLVKRILCNESRIDEKNFAEVESGEMKKCSHKWKRK